MSVTNLGSQTITFDYKEPATGKDFGEFARDLIKPGVYKGGNLSITKTLSVDGVNEIAIASFHVWLNSQYTESGTEYSLGCHAFTRSNVLLEPGTQIGGNKYVFVSFTYSKTVSNWMDFRISTSATPNTNEIILGTLTFDGSGDVTIANTTNRTYGGLYTTDSQTYTTRTEDIYVEGDFVATSGTISFEDKLLTVNKNNDTASSIGAGINILGDSDAIVGYFRVDSSDNSLLTLKAPTGNVLTLDINADKTLTIADTVTIDATVDINAALITNGTLTVESASLINQDLTTDSTGVTFAALTLTSLFTASGTTLNISSGCVLQHNGTGVLDSTTVPRLINTIKKSNVSLKIIGGTTTMNTVFDTLSPYIPADSGEYIAYGYVYDTSIYSPITYISNTGTSITIGYLSTSINAPDGSGTTLPASWEVWIRI